MSDSIYANARAAALTGSLLGADRLSRMADCASADEAVKILQEVNFGEGAAADRIETAVLALLAGGRDVTRDLGGSLGTSQFADAVIDKMRE